MKATMLKQKVARSLRRSKRRLKRAQRKASKTGKAIDKVKIDRAQVADDSAQEAAHRVISAAKIHKQQQERRQKRRKVLRVKAEADKAMRRAAKELEKAAESGSRTRLELAHQRLEEAQKISKKATEEEIDEVKQNGQRDYEKALEYTGSPQGGGPVETEIDRALIKLTNSVRDAMESKKESDYKVAKEQLDNAERTVAQLQRHHKRKALRKLVAKHDKLKTEMEESMKKYTEERLKVEAQVQVVSAAKKDQKVRTERAHNSKRGLEIASVLMKVAEDNYMMSSRQISRDKQYVLRMKDNTKRASHEVRQAQREATIASRKYLRMTKNETGISFASKIESEKEKILQVKFTTAERVKEIKSFFDQQEGMNNEILGKPLDIEGEKDTVLEKVEFHAKQSIQNSENEISILEMEQDANATTATTSMVDAQGNQTLKAAEVKAEAEIQAQEGKDIQSEQLKVQKARGATAAAQKATSKVIAAAQESADRELEKLKLKKANARSPEEVKNIEGYESTVRKKLRDVKRNEEDKIAKMKSEAGREKVNADAMEEISKQKAEDKRAQVKQIAEEAKSNAKEDTATMVESIKEDTKAEKKETAQQEAKNGTKSVEEQQQKSEDLLTKLQSTREEIEKALHYHLKKAVSNLDELAQEAKEKDVEQKVEAEQAEETKKVEMKMVEAENAAISKKLSADQADHKKEKKAEQKAEKAAVREEVKEYKKLTAGVTDPSVIEPSVDVGPSEVTLLESHEHLEDRIL